MVEPAAIQRAKAALRQEVQGRLQRLSPEARQTAAMEFQGRIEGLDLWKRARSVLAFAPLPGELDIWPLLLRGLQEGKTIALPRYDSESGTYSGYCIGSPDDLVRGRFGIREPANHCQPPASKLLDLILVPGLAFDSLGRRLGRGKGFYDRLLSDWRGTTCGVCFDEQIVESIPMEPHDVQLDCILTPSRFFQPGGSE